ncbi:hypothetical protein OAH12_01665 [Cyclobacteriaceae bacterium]|nr:hypothetical protein [Cyclobacteriaceae bacterium]
MRALFCLMILVSSGVVVAQRTDSLSGRHLLPFSSYKEIGFVAGIEQGTYSNFEIGLGLSHAINGHHGPAFMGASLAYFFNPWRDLHGMKAAAWVNTPLAPLNIGWSSSVLTDGTYTRGGFGPMTGIGFMYAHISYSFQIRFGEKEVKGLNNHLVTVRFFLPVHSKEISEPFD